MTNRTVDQMIAELASRQHGLFTRRQVIALGASGSLVGRRLAAGVWIRRADGLYQLPSAVRGWRMELQAGLLAHPGCVVARRAAGALHRWHDFPEGPVQFLAPGAPNYRTHGALGRTQDLLAEDRTVVDGFATTTPLRTILDLAAVMRRRRLEWLVDDLLAAKAFSIEELHERFVHLTRKGKPGMANMREILDVRGPGYVPPASRLEARMLEVLAGAGLPAPVRQHPLPSRAGPGRVDAAYPLQRVLIEGDSRRYHTRVRDFENDRRRDNEATALGWRIIRVTWQELRDHPDRFVQQVRDCLRRAA